jgi:segregation and condensation protein B
MDDFEIKPILESLIFMSDNPVRLETLIEILPESNKEAILEGIEQIKREYAETSKGFELMEVAGGYQFRTKPRWAQWVSRLKKAKAVKLSRSALETLAIVAYRQPIIRPEIEKIRGVDSGWVLRTLLEKDLIRVLSRRDIPGRPIVYGTTKAFLELFNLNTLSDLPTLKEIEPPQVPEAMQQQEVRDTLVESTAPDESAPGKEAGE